MRTLLQVSAPITRPCPGGESPEFLTGQAQTPTSWLQGRAGSESRPHLGFLSPRGERGALGFTLVELMIGVALSMMVMAAVLSSYVFVARSYTRTIGFGLPNQPTLESQGRRTLTYFSRDVQVASGIYTGTTPAAYALSDKKVTLIVPRATGGSRYVTYYCNDTTSAAPVTNGSTTVSVPANALARIDWGSGTVLTLHSSLESCAFAYFDTFADIAVPGTARPYTAYLDYLIGIKQISLTLSAQAGTGSNQTKLYRIASPRYLLRNKIPPY